MLKSRVEGFSLCRYEVDDTVRKGPISSKGIKKAVDDDDDDSSMMIPVEEIEGNLIELVQMLY